MIVKIHIPFITLVSNDNYCHHSRQYYRWYNHWHYIRPRYNYCYNNITTYNNMH